MKAYLDFPAWLKPEIIPGLPFRWYGLMYVVAFACAWFLFRRESRRVGLDMNDDDMTNAFFWGIAGILLGGRLAGTLIYEPTDYYWRKPWFIFWPFDESGRFVGFQGMSFHGGFAGLIVATLVWCRVQGRSWLLVVDTVAVAAPLGYTFGRLGNFINGELWGKVTHMPWGIVFPYAQPFPARELWVQELALKVGIPMSSLNDMINLPRHPSQLYEALFEGLLLWVFLWFIVRPRKPFAGYSGAMYAIGYGVVRFFIEYFREPDASLGYIIKLGDPAAPISRLVTPFNFSMGQLLCVLMIAAGWIMIAVLRKRHLHPIVAAAPPLRGRRLRKKIKS